MSKLPKELVEDVVALTPTQEGILLTYLKDPNTREYFVQSTADLSGEIDELLFARAWQVLVDRHQALRSTFRWEGLSAPVQIVLKRHTPEIRLVDAGAHGDGEHQLETLKREDRERGHDLLSVPFRVALIRTSSARYKLLLSYHHIILDGWSLGVLASEFLEAYHALKAGASSSLHKSTAPPLAEYLRWHQTQKRPAQAEFWKRYLDGHEVGQGMLLKRAEGAATLRSRELTQLIPPSLDKKLRAFAAESNTTLASVFYTAFALVLSKYCRSDDVVFGTTVSGRSAEVAQVHRLVGNFINTPPLRVKLHHQTLAELCRAVSESMRARQPFETTSMVDIRRALGLHQDPFDAIMVVENYALTLDARELQLSQLRSDEETSYDLTVSLTVHEGLAVQWSYRRNRLGEADVRRIGERFLVALEQIVHEPGLAVQQAELLTRGERELLLEKFSRGPALVREVPESFVGDFLDVVRRTPSAPALAFEGEVLTYAQLEARSAVLAEHLASRGVRMGIPVAVMLERSAEMVVALVATMRCGGVYVPLSPRVPSQRALFIIENSEARVIVVHDQTADRLPELPERISKLNLSKPLPDPTPSATALAAPQGGDLAYIMYTSGSSGAPKGVMVEHRALMNTLQWYIEAFGFDSKRRALAMFDASADTALEDVLAALTTGGVIHVASRERLFDREAFCQYVEREQINFLSYLPSALRELLPSDRRLPTVDTVVVGSEPLTEDFKNTLLRLGYRLFNCYGTTETAIDSLTQVCRIEKPVTLGRPNSNTRCLILDRQGQLCAIGAPGELMLLGPGLGRGYWRRDDLTAKAFTECPVLPGARMYRTGDLALWQEDGEVRYLGRIDAQLKLSGFRVEPQEIEAALIAHPNVKEAAVCAYRLEGGATFLSAFIVGKTSTDLETKNLLGKGLRHHLTARLPEQMIPNRFFAVESLPRLPNGKVDGRALQARVVEADAQEYVAPADEIEQQIAAIWGNVLGRDKVTTQTPFRELGGDSLMLIRIYSQLNQRFPGVLKVQDLFDHRTIQEIASVIRERTAPQAATAGVKILTF